MNHHQLIKVKDYLIYKNKIIMKCLALLWASKAHDLLFINFEDHIRIELKGFKDFNNPVGIISHTNFRKLCMQIKLCCHLDILNSKPQSGSFGITINKYKYQIRSSFHPSNYGENLSFRMINPMFFQNNLPKINWNGFNIIGGRTCSGKTTLMYGLMNNFKGRVISLEDPVEYNIPNVTQTDISIIGYEDGIKSALRQNPDLICIGEIRDLDSAQMAIRAALTGHKVLATIHTISEQTIIHRLQELGCLFIRETLNQFILCSNFEYQIFSLKDELLPIKSR